MDKEANVQLTRYDSVKTEQTTSSTSSRASSMHCDSLPNKRPTNKGIELMRLNESFSETPPTPGRMGDMGGGGMGEGHPPLNDTLSMSSSLCPEEHDYGLRLKFDHVPLTNGYHDNHNNHNNNHHDVYGNVDIYHQGVNGVFGGSSIGDKHCSMAELSNGTCTYDTFRRKTENC